FLKFLAFLHGARTATFRNFPVAWYPFRSLEFVGIHRMSFSSGSGNTNALEQSQSLLDELVSPVASATARHRVRIIDRITDLFAVGSRNYSHEQVALFDDVLGRLCTDIEAKARAKLAERLAGMHRAPPKLVRSFAFDDAIEVAGPVLVRSQQ